MVKVVNQRGFLFRTPVILTHGMDNHGPRADVLLDLYKLVHDHEKVCPDQSHHMNL